MILESWKEILLEFTFLKKKKWEKKNKLEWKRKTGKKTNITTEWPIYTCLSDKLLVDFAQGLSVFHINLYIQLFVTDAYLFF